MGYRDIQFHSSQGGGHRRIDVPHHDDAIKPPDLMIYLRCSMRTLRQRIRLRGREMEQDVPIAYLKRLDDLYEKWIESYELSDVLILETDKLDYINDLIHRLDVMERIEAVLPPELGKPPCT